MSDTTAHDRPERAVTTRTRLIRAATAAFADKGFDATTTRDIASAAGMSPAALYVHHKSKEELLYLISASGHRNTLALVRAAIARGGGPVESLRAMVYDFALHHARKRTEARIVNYELGSLTAEHFAEIRGLRRATESEVRGIVDRGVRTGSFDVTDAHMAAVTVLSLGIDIARWYHDGGRWTPEYIAECYAQTALRIVGGHALAQGTDESVRDGKDTMTP